MSEIKYRKTRRDHDECRCHLVRLAISRPAHFPKHYCEEHDCLHSLPYTTRSISVASEKAVSGSSQH